MTRVTKKKVAKKKVTKKAPAKKVAQKKEFDLNDIESELEGFSLSLIGEDEPEESIAPYIIPFHMDGKGSEGLQKISGGIFGGKFCEISGNSQAGKSFLLYQLMANAIKMGGYALLFDGERAFEEPYAKIVGLNIRSGHFAFGEKRSKTQKNKGIRGEPIVDIDDVFHASLAFAKAIRSKKKDLTIPIIIGIDSYPTLSTDIDMENMEKGKDPRGYQAMQKNAKFYSWLAQALPKFDQYAVTFVLLNQLTKDYNITYGDPWKSNAEEKIKFYATQRLRGKLAGKLKDKKTKVQIGMSTLWTTIKNRGVRPFQSVQTDVLYSKGLLPKSGLEQLLIDDLSMRAATQKNEETGKTDKGFKPLIGDNEGKFYPTLDELLAENREEMLKPKWTGDDLEDVDIEREDVDVDGEDDTNEDD
jgi:RecA/RadA recombinase